MTETDFPSRWMPESARWLIANGKVEKAQMYMSKCAKINQTNESLSTLNKEVRVFFQLGYIKINTQLVFAWFIFFTTKTFRFKTLASIIVTDKKERTYSYLDLVRTPNMRKLACRTGLLWCVFFRITVPTWYFPDKFFFTASNQDTHCRPTGFVLPLHFTASALTLQVLASIYIWPSLLMQW